MATYNVKRHIRAGPGCKYMENTLGRQANGFNMTIKKDRTGVFVTNIAVNSLNTYSKDFLSAKIG